MQQIAIPEIRANSLTRDDEKFHYLERRLKCSLRVEDDNQVIIEGEPLDEFNAKNVIQAYGRGFEVKDALLLLKEEETFTSINLKEMTSSEAQRTRLKSRVIGSDGKTKGYIERVSGVVMCIYGNTISMIGNMEETKIAMTAVNILLEGGTHKKAYAAMEKERKDSTQIGWLNE